MRNKYKGICYYCNEPVDVGKGHFEKIPYYERVNGVMWRTIHANCVFAQRDEKLTKEK